MSKLEARFTDRRIVHDRKKPGGVRHDGPIKEPFIVLGQIDEVNISIQIRILLAELEQYALQLKFLALGYVRQETDQAQLFLFGIRKGCGFIQPRIPEKFDSQLFRHGALLSILSSWSRRKDGAFSLDRLHGQTLLRLRIRAWSRPASA